MEGHTRAVDSSARQGTAEDRTGALLIHRWEGHRLLEDAAAAIREPFLGDTTGAKPLGREALNVSMAFIPNYVLGSQNGSGSLLESLPFVREEAKWDRKNGQQDGGT